MEGLLTQVVSTASGPQGHLQRLLLCFHPQLNDLPLAESPFALLLIQNESLYGQDVPHSVPTLIASYE